MKYEAKSIEEYIDLLPDDRKEVIRKLRNDLKEFLPHGFEETLEYDMISFVVPKNIYEKGYHVDPNLPLPFVSLASQKNHVAIYHMGIYMFPEILEWFKKEYSKVIDTKLDMGKSCIRFKNPKKIPYELLKELYTKITTDMYIKRYEEQLKVKSSI